MACQWHLRHQVHRRGLARLAEDIGPQLEYRHAVKRLRGNKLGVEAHRLVEYPVALGLADLKRVVEVRVALNILRLEDPAWTLKLRCKRWQPSLLLEYEFF